MWKQAIEDTLRVTRANIERFKGQFPHVSRGNRIYALNPAFPKNYNKD